jgi:hypothetical protein
MRKWIFAMAIPVGVLAATSSVQSEEISRDLHKSFEVQKGYTLHLDHGDGDVTITPWDKDIIDVEVHYRAEAKSVGIGGKLRFDVDFRQGGDVIHVIDQERISGSIGYRYFKRYEYTYDIRAPHYIQLDLEGDDGDVQISKWRARIQCSLEDGDVDLEDIVSPRADISVEDGDLNISGMKGELWVDAEDGDVELSDSETSRCQILLEDGDVTIRRSQGDFEIDVEDGEVNLYELRAGTLEISASDGDVEGDLLETDDIDVDISTEDGDVTLNLQSGMSASFIVETEDGRVRLDLPSAEDVKKRKRRASGVLGDGRGRIQIQTADGSVTLRESD